MLLFSISAILSAILYILFTRWGTDVGYDSYYYLRGAEGILAGIGLGWTNLDGSFSSLTHFPPLYSVFVAAFSGLLNIQILYAARICAVLFSSLCAGLAAVYAHKLTRSWMAAIAAATLVIVFKPMTSVMIGAMSEGLFFALLVGYLWSANQWFTLHKTRDLILTSIILAGMLLTRYAALAVIISFGLSTLWIERSQLKKRIKLYGLSALIAVLPGLFWLIQNFLTSGSSTNRAIVYHPLTRGQLQTAWESIKLWFIPNEAKLGWHYSGVVLVVAVVALLIVITYLNRHGLRTFTENKKFTTAVALLMSYVVVYPLFLWISYTFIDASTRWTNRILSPWLFAISLLTILVVYHLNSFQKTRLYGIALAASAMLLLGIQVLSNTNYLSRLNSDGEGFTAKAYQKSRLLEALQQYPKGAPVFTNNVALVYFNLNKETVSIPEMQNSIQQTANLGYQENLVKMHTTIQDGQGVLVLFKPYTELGNVYPTLEELIAGMTLEYKSPEGNIYR